MLVTVRRVLQSAEYGLASDDLFEQQPQGLRLVPGTYTTDALTFQHACRQADALAEEHEPAEVSAAYRAALGLYTGPYLDWLPLTVNPWADERRAFVQNTVVLACEAVAEIALAANDFATVNSYARLGIQADPMASELYVLLFEALLALRRGQEAEGLIHSYRQAVGDALDAHDEVLRAYQRLRRASSCS